MKRPFAHIGFSFAAAMLVLNLVKTEYAALITAGLAVVFTAALALKKYRQALAVPLCAGAALFACLVFLCVYHSTVPYYEAMDYQSAQTTFYIADLPSCSDGVYHYIIKTTEVNLANAPQEMKLRLNTREPLEADCYQLMQAKLTFYNIADNAYASYGYWSRNIFLSSRAEDIVVTNSVVPSPMRAVLHLRKEMASILMNRIEGDAGAFSVAVLTGNRSEMSAYARNNFIFSGTSHLMAVSGLHLTVITGAFLFVLKHLRVKDKPSFLLTLLLILFYSALTGFPKSVVRAGVMMTVMVVGKLAGKRGDTLNSLGAAVFIICLNPFAVCDAGAVYSVLSVLALCTAAPHFHVGGSNAFLRLAVYAANAFAATFCIMAYTLPVSYLFFGYVAVIGLISNIVMIPLGSLSTVMSLATYLLNRVPVLSSLTARLTEMLNRLILLSAEFFASFRMSTLSFGKYFGIVIAGVLIIFAFCFMLNKKEWLRPAAAVCTAIVLTAAAVNIAYAENSAAIYAVKDNAVVIICEGKTVVCGVNSKNSYYAVVRYLTSERKTIDVLLTDGEDSGFAVMLSNTVPCRKVVSNRFDDNLLQHSVCPQVVVSDDYQNELSDRFQIAFKNVNGASRLTAEVYDTSFVMGNTVPPESNIAVLGKYIYDDYGTVDLSDGGVIYQISKEKAYAARRVGVWQK